MKALSPTLEAAQRSGSAQPAIAAVLSDEQSFVSRFRFQRIYTGSEAAGPAAVVVAGDGSLVRARIDPTTDTLYTQRVISPAPASTFSSWTSQGLVGIGTTCALACFGSTVYLFFVHLDTLRVRMKVSTDNGATYSAASTVATEASPVTHVACQRQRSRRRGAPLDGRHEHPQRPIYGELVLACELGEVRRLDYRHRREFPRRLPGLRHRH
jgi:hypothetical protein